MQAAADAAYTALLRGTLETAGGTAADDRAALRAGGLAPRARLALEFRTAQRVLLNAELAAAAASKASFWRAFWLMRVFTFCILQC